MANLTMAHQELFRRSPDECYNSLETLYQKCQQDQERSHDYWQSPSELVVSSDMTLSLGDDPDNQLTNWSFSQLCRLAGVSKDTVNRLTPKTASRVFQETIPTGSKPIQFLSSNDLIRSMHGVSYTRLWNVELLDVINEFATDFQVPQQAGSGGTGLYCGEQDCFLFLVDPTGWAEIDGQAFAPGFFCWNSEVGRRSLGIQTFWWQAVCANHIVWDAVEVVDFTRKHTAKVHDGLDEIRRIIERLVQQREQRRDGFAAVLKKAMTTKLGDDVDEAFKELTRNGIPRNLAKNALEIAKQSGSLTIFSLVDALTQLTQQIPFAGDRLDADVKASSLLSLAV